MTCRTAIERMFKSDRRGRSSRLVDPAETQRTLLKFHEAANYGQDPIQVLNERQGNELRNCSLPTPIKVITPYYRPYRKGRI